MKVLVGEPHQVVCIIRAPSLWGLIAVRLPWEVQMTAISGELAIQIIRGAFAPFHCGAEVYDYGNAVRLNVVDESNNSLLKLSGITADEFSNTERLGALLERLRDDLIHHKDVRLEPWQMPAVKVIAT